MEIKERLIRMVKKQNAALRNIVFDSMWFYFVLLVNMLFLFAKAGAGGFYLPTIWIWCFGLVCLLFKTAMQYEDSK